MLVCILSYLFISLFIAYCCIVVVSGAGKLINSLLIVMGGIALFDKIAFSLSFIFFFGYLIVFHCLIAFNPRLHAAKVSEVIKSWVHKHMNANDPQTTTTSMQTMRMLIYVCTFIGGISFKVVGVLLSSYKNDGTTEAGRIGIVLISSLLVGNFFCMSQLIRVGSDIMFAIGNSATDYSGKSGLSDAEWKASVTEHVMRLGDKFIWNFR